MESTSTTLQQPEHHTDPTAAFEPKDSPAIAVEQNTTGIATQAWTYSPASPNKIKAADWGRRLYGKASAKFR
jgi:hypothetical protein